MHIDWLIRLSWSKPLAMTLKPNPSPRRLPPPSRSSAMAADGSVLRRLYLSVYNWVVFIGWAQVSWSMTLALLESGHEAVYAAIEWHLLFAQTAAIMEVSGKYYIRVPNKWNFSFDYFYFSAFFMSLYVPVFPYLLRHMVAQRKKALSKAKTT